MYFEESLRGLTVGAPVEVNGVTIGEVKSIMREWDNQTRAIRFPG